MRYANGSTFIEILISMTLLSLALLGLDAVQLTAFRDLKATYYLAIAAQELEQLQHQLQLLPEEATQTALAEWNAQLQQVLPQGKGFIQNHALAVFWGDEHATECEQPKIGNPGCLTLETP